MTTLRPQTRPTTIPGPTGSPLFGMARAIRHDLLGTLLEGFRRYGDVVSYPIGPPRGPRRLRQNVVALHHPDAVHQILTNARDFGRETVAFGVLAEMIGDGLLTSDGETWTRQRRTLQPLFTPRRVVGYTDLMAAEADRIVGRSGGGAVDLHALMQQYTLRVVGRALFGDDVDDAVAELRALVPLSGDLVVGRTMQLARLPLGLSTPGNARFTRVRARLYGIVERILSRRAGAGETADDMVGRLHAARDPETGAPLSTQEIRDQLLVFLLAGHETTAGALTFTLHLLGRHPEVQDRVAADPDLARAAVLEGMRLYPPVPATERMVTVDTDLGGYPVAAGTVAVAAQWVTHRHPEFWPAPETFDIDRFVGTHDRPRYAYFPFGGGPRSCVGEHFSVLEATVLLNAVLARYRVAALDPRVPLMTLVTLRPAAPVRASLIRRSG